jgi:hypothetical protein
MLPHAGSLVTDAPQTLLGLNQACALPLHPQNSFPLQAGESQDSVQLL